ncbi:uncharacterized protein [Ranitomeya imitator]|uniref:uncharacterized protein n=1 Tax=Ranitomeya imitator TaxID=111125 RepID=UPI0037E83EBE
MSSSSEEEQRPGPAQGGNVSESSSSTVAEAEQEQLGHGRVARRQRVPVRDEDLIENDLLNSLVHERVPLWDTQVPQHSDNVTIRRLWNEVGQAMMDGWDNAPTRVRNAFLFKVKTCWRSMKDRFNKDLRQESWVPSGSGARICKYKYHRILAFLRPAVLAQKTTRSNTLDPGSGAVLHQTATVPSQPSSSAAASGPATQTGDQEAGPSGVPLSKSSAPFLGGSSRQRQRASDRSLMPKFLHLSSVSHDGLKAMGDRLDSAINLMNTLIQEVIKSLDQVKADLQIHVKVRNFIIYLIREIRFFLL